MENAEIEKELADPSNWPGQGLLGKVLMQVRGDLRSQTTEE